MKRILLPLLLSIMSGLLLTAGFPKSNFFFLSWIALVPLLAALRERTWKEAILLGYICGLAHCLTTFYWIRYVIYHYGGLPLPLALGVLLLLCLYLAIYPAGFAFLAQRWKGHSLLWTFGLPAVWITLEWIRAHAVTGFPWANLGYTQTDFPWLPQIADITGVYGVGWLVVLGNMAIADSLHRKRVRTSLIGFGLCLIVALGYGSWRVRMVHGMEDQAKSWNVGVIQGNIDQSRKWDPAFQQETLRRYNYLSLQAANAMPRPDLLVWPETAAPFFYGIDETLTAELVAIIQKAQVPVLFGSLGVTLVAGQPRLQNRAYLVSDNGTLLGAYAKQHLVPFGEYVPYQRLLFFVHKLVEVVGEFVPGNNSTPLAINGHKLGVLICYEGVFPELSRRTVQKGADVLVNITNDAWYGNTSAPYQHLEIARWRTIEFRVPLVRSANSGVSAIYDASGSPLGTIPLNMEGELVVPIRPIKLKTFYAIWGDLFAWFCVIISVCGVLYSETYRHLAKSHN